MEAMITVTENSYDWLYWLTQEIYDNLYLYSHIPNLKTSPRPPLPHHFWTYTQQVIIVRGCLLLDSYHINRGGGNTENSTLFYILKSCLREKKSTNLIFDNTSNS